MKMKQNFYLRLSLLLFIFLICSSSSLAANPQDINPGQEEAKLIGISTSPVSDDIPMEDDGESISELMGLEICKEGDEECLRRRMTAEAHLDYIYTQHHKH